MNLLIMKEFSKVHTLKPNIDKREEFPELDLTDT